MLSALYMIDHILIEHGPLVNLAGIELIDLVPYQVHRVNLLVHTGLWLGNHIPELQVGLVLEGPTSSALVRAVVSNDGGS